MRHLQHEPQAAPSRIAHATGRQRPNLSTVLRDPERKGLIERHARDDGRSVTVTLTERGRTNYALARREWAAMVAAAAGADESDLDAALRLLGAVRTELTQRRRSDTDS